MTDLISVVLALYNGEKYIKEQLVSIINQTKPVQEIVICDDCSTDKSIDIVQELKEMTLGISFKIIQNKKNLGYIRNFHEGISASKGDFIFLADQDDIWMPDKVEVMLRFMKESNATLACSNFSLIDQDGKDIVGEYQIPKFILEAPSGVSKIDLHSLLYGNVAQGCTYCFTSQVKKIYLEMENFDVIHDYQLMLIAAALGGAVLINSKLIKYRLHGNNSVGFKEKKDLSHVKFHFPFSKPKVMTIMQFLRPYLSKKEYRKCKVVLYLRLPVWKAVINRFLK